MRPSFSSLLAILTLCAAPSCARSSPAKGPARVAAPETDAPPGPPPTAAPESPTPVASGPATGPAAHPVKLEEKPDPPAPERNYPAILSFGFGGLGALIGAVGGGLSFAKFDEVTRACGGTRCPESMRGDVEAGQTMAAVSTVGVVIAGLGAAQGIFFTLVPGGELRPSPSTGTGPGTSTGTRPGTSTGLVVGPSFTGVKGTF